MPASLLRDPAEPLTIADARESAYYVLTWLALHFVKNASTETGTTINRRMLCRRFREENYSTKNLAKGRSRVIQVTGGGALKIKHITTKGTADEVIYNNPHLNPLISELQETFGSRYYEAAGARATNAASDTSCKEGENVQTDLQECDDKLALERERKKANLTERGWFVDTLYRYLDQEGWPHDDVLQPRPCYTNYCWW